MCRLRYIITSSLLLFSRTVCRPLAPPVTYDTTLSQIDSTVTFQHQHATPDTCTTISKKPTRQSEISTPCDEGIHESLLSLDNSPNVHAIARWLRDDASSYAQLGDGATVQGLSSEHHNIWIPRADDTTSLSTSQGSSLKVQPVVSAQKILQLPNANNAAATQTETSEAPSQRLKLQLHYRQVPSTPEWNHHQSQPYGIRSTLMAIYGLIIGVSFGVPLSQLLLLWYVCWRHNRDREARLAQIALENRARNKEHGVAIQYSDKPLTDPIPEQNLRSNNVTVRSVYNLPTYSDSLLAPNGAQQVDGTPQSPVLPTNHGSEAARAQIPPRILSTVLPAGQATLPPTRGVRPLRSHAWHTEINSKRQPSITRSATV